MYPQYIVLAHLPLTEDDPAFEGEFGLHRTEWVIFTGALGERQALAKADKFRKHFREVQIRKVSEEI